MIEQNRSEQKKTARDGGRRVAGRQPFPDGGGEEEEGGQEGDRDKIFPAEHTAAGAESGEEPAPEGAAAPRSEQTVVEEKKQ